MNKLEELDALVKRLRAGTAHLSLREIEEHWADAADALEAAMTTQKLSATKPAQEDNLYRLSVLVESDVLPDGLEVRRVVKAALQEFAALRRDAALLRAQAEEIARLRESAQEAQELLSELARPKEGSSVMNVWTRCVAAELKIRRALAKAEGQTP